MKQIRRTNVSGSPVWGSKKQMVIAILIGVASAAFFLVLFSKRFARWRLTAIAAGLGMELDPGAQSLKELGCDRLWRLRVWNDRRNLLHGTVRGIEIAMVEVRTFDPDGDPAQREGFYQLVCFRLPGRSLPFFHLVKHSGTYLSELDILKGLKTPHRYGLTLKGNPGFSKEFLLSLEKTGDAPALRQLLSRNVQDFFMQTSKDKWWEVQGADEWIGFGGTGVSVPITSNPYRRMIDEASRLYDLFTQSPTKPDAIPSTGDLLDASIMNIHHQTQEQFVACLKDITAGITDPLSIKDSVPPSSNITWDNSEALRDASNLASDPPTRATGIAKLEALCQAHPACSAPYALLAQAMSQNQQQEQAKKLLLDAIRKVHIKSEILDMLGNLSKDTGNHRTATAYYFLAAYAMNPDSTDWGTMVYLSAVYEAAGNEQRAKECDDAAKSMRRGNRAQLTEQLRTAIRETVQQNKILTDLASSAWPLICDNIGRLSGKYGKETWSPGPAPVTVTVEPQIAVPVTSPSQAKIVTPASNQKGRPEKEIGFCQMCRKGGIHFKIFADRAFFLCSPDCENRYGTLRADAIKLSQVSHTIDTTGSGIAEQMRIKRQRAYHSNSYCWFCGESKKMGLDTCASCNRQADVPV